MEFSRAIAHACFTALMWLMLVTGVLFAALAVVQYWEGDNSANPVVTIGSAAGSLLFAGLLKYLARRIIA